MSQRLSRRLFIASARELATARTAMVDAWCR
jgi:hypothetical protein